ncbi:uncharacterized protein LOC143201266 [Rhynchophorus ferrugineus]|uniref:uncharacterized protein LOC143201266 n=1 Tax=Rhynchophorus ferrugineus TaxID=354439 RepID=UPI003FCDC51E
MSGEKEKSRDQTLLDKDQPEKPTVPGEEENSKDQTSLDQEKRDSTHELNLQTPVSSNNLGITPENANDANMISEKEEKSKDQQSLDEYQPEGTQHLKSADKDGSDQKDTERCSAKDEENKTKPVIQTRKVDSVSINNFLKSEQMNSLEDITQPTEKPAGVDEKPAKTSVIGDSIKSSTIDILSSKMIDDKQKRDKSKCSFGALSAAVAGATAVAVAAVVSTDDDKDPISDSDILANATNLSSINSKGSSTESHHSSKSGKVVSKKIDDDICNVAKKHDVHDSELTDSDIWADITNVDHLSKSLHSRNTNKTGTSSEKQDKADVKVLMSDIEQIKQIKDAKNDVQPTPSNEVTKNMLESKLSAEEPGVVDSQVKKFLHWFIDNERENVFQMHSIDYDSISLDSNGIITNATDPPTSKNLITPAGENIEPSSTKDTHISANHLEAIDSGQRKKRSIENNEDNDIGDSSALSEPIDSKEKTIGEDEPKATDAGSKEIRVESSVKDESSESTNDHKERTETKEPEVDEEQSINVESRASKNDGTIKEALPLQSSSKEREQSDNDVVIVDQQHTDEGEVRGDSSDMSNDSKDINFVDKEAPGASQQSAESIDEKNGSEDKGQDHQNDIVLNLEPEKLTKTMETTEKINLEPITENKQSINQLGVPLINSKEGINKDEVQEEIVKPEDSKIISLDEQSCNGQQEKNTVKEGAKDVVKCADTNIIFTNEKSINQESQLERGRDEQKIDDTVKLGDSNVISIKEQSNHGQLKTKDEPGSNDTVTSGDSKITSIKEKENNENKEEVKDTIKSGDSEIIPTDEKSNDAQQEKNKDDEEAGVTVKSEDSKIRSINEQSNNGQMEMNKDGKETKVAVKLEDSKIMLINEKSINSQQEKSKDEEESNDIVTSEDSTVIHINQQSNDNKQENNKDTEEAKDTVKSEDSKIIVTDEQTDNNQQKKSKDEKESNDTVTSEDSTVIYVNQQSNDNKQENYKDTEEAKDTDKSEDSKIIATDEQSDNNQQEKSKDGEESNDTVISKESTIIPINQQSNDNKQENYKDSEEAKDTDKSEDSKIIATDEQSDNNQQEKSKDGEESNDTVISKDSIIIHINQQSNDNKQENNKDTEEAKNIDKSEDSKIIATDEQSDNTQQEKSKDGEESNDTVISKDSTIIHINQQSNDNKQENYKDTEEAKDTDNSEDSKIIATDEQSDNNQQEKSKDGEESNDTVISKDSTIIHINQQSIDNKQDNNKDTQEAKYTDKSENSKIIATDEQSDNNQQEEIKSQDLETICMDNQSNNRQQEKNKDEAKDVLNNIVQEKHKSTEMVASDDFNALVPPEKDGQVQDDQSINAEGILVDRKVIDKELKKNYDENLKIHESSGDKTVDIEYMGRKKQSSINDTLPVPHIVQNITNMNLSSVNSGVVDESIKDYLKSFITSELNDVHKDIVVDKVPKQENAKMQENTNVKSPSKIARYSNRGKNDKSPTSKYPRRSSLSQIMTSSHEDQSTNAKIKRAQSVGVLRQRQNEHKSRIPTASRQKSKDTTTRKSAGRRPLVRQMETNSKELEEKLSSRRGSKEISKSQSLKGKSDDTKENGSTEKAKELKNSATFVVDDNSNSTNLKENGEDKLCDSVKMSSSDSQDILKKTAETLLHIPDSNETEQKLSETNNRTATKIEDASILQNDDQESPKTNGENNKTDDTDIHPQDNAQKVENTTSNKHSSLDTLNECNKSSQMNVKEETIPQISSDENNTNSDDHEQTPLKQENDNDNEITNKSNDLNISDVYPSKFNEGQEVNSTDTNRSSDNHSSNTKTEGVQDTTAPSENVSKTRGESSKPDEDNNSESTEKTESVTMIEDPVEVTPFGNNTNQPSDSSVQQNEEEVIKSIEVSDSAQSHVSKDTSDMDKNISQHNENLSKLPEDNKSKSSEKSVSSENNQSESLTDDTVKASPANKDAEKSKHESLQENVENGTKISETSRDDRDKVETIENEILSDEGSGQTQDDSLKLSEDSKIDNHLSNQLRKTTEDTIKTKPLDTISHQSPEESSKQNNDSAVESIEAIETGKTTSSATESSVSQTNNDSLTLSADRDISKEYSSSVETLLESSISESKDDETKGQSSDTNYIYVQPQVLSESEKNDTLLKNIHSKVIASDKIEDEKLSPNENNDYISKTTSLPDNVKSSLKNESSSDSVDHKVSKTDTNLSNSAADVLKDINNEIATDQTSIKTSDTSLNLHEDEENDPKDTSHSEMKAKDFKQDGNQTKDDLVEQTKDSRDNTELTDYLPNYKIEGTQENISTESTNEDSKEDNVKTNYIEDSNSQINEELESKDKLEVNETVTNLEPEEIQVTKDNIPLLKESEDAMDKNGILLNETKNLDLISDKRNIKENENQSENVQDDHSNKLEDPQNDGIKEDIEIDTEQKEEKNQNKQLEFVEQNQKVDDENDSIQSEAINNLKEDNKEAHEENQKPDIHQVPKSQEDNIIRTGSTIPTDNNSNGNKIDVNSEVSNDDNTNDQRNDGFQEEDKTIEENNASGTKEDIKDKHDDKIEDNQDNTNPIEVKKEENRNNTEINEVSNVSVIASQPKSNENISQNIEDKSHVNTEDHNTEHKKEDIAIEESTDHENNGEIRDMNEKNDELDLGTQLDQKSKEGDRIEITENKKDVCNNTAIGNEAANVSVIASQHQLDQNTSQKTEDNLQINNEDLVSKEEDKSTEQRNESENSGNTKENINDKNEPNQENRSSNKINFNLLEPESNKGIDDGTNSTVNNKDDNESSTRANEVTNKSLIVSQDQSDISMSQDMEDKSQTSTEDHVTSGINAIEIIPKKLEQGNDKEIIDTVEKVPKAEVQKNEDHGAVVEEIMPKEAHSKAESLADRVSNKDHGNIETNKKSEESEKVTDRVSRTKTTEESKATGKIIVPIDSKMDHINKEDVKEHIDNGENGLSEDPESKTEREDNKLPEREMEYNEINKVPLIQDSSNVGDINAEEKKGQDIIIKDFDQNLTENVYINKPEPDKSNTFDENEEKIKHKEDSKEKLEGDSENYDISNKATNLPHTKQGETLKKNTDDRGDKEHSETNDKKSKEDFKIPDEADTDKITKEQNKEENITLDEKDNTQCEIESIDFTQSQNKNKELEENKENEKALDKAEQRQEETPNITTSLNKQLSQTQLKSAQDQHQEIEKPKEDKYGKLGESLTENVDKQKSLDESVLTDSHRGSNEELRNKEEIAATKLQSAWRGYLARKNLGSVDKKTPKTKMTTQEAVVKIQSLVRGYLERQRHQRRLLQEKPSFYRKDTVDEPQIIKKLVSQLQDSTDEPAKIDGRDDNNNNQRKEETQLEQEVRSAVDKVVRGYDTHRYMTPLEREVSTAVRHLMDSNDDDEDTLSHSFDKHEDHLEKVIKQLPPVPSHDIPKTISDSSDTESQSSNENKLQFIVKKDTEDVTDSDDVKTATSNFDEDDTNQAPLSNINVEVRKNSDPDEDSMPVKSPVFVQTDLKHQKQYESVSDLDKLSTEDVPKIVSDEKPKSVCSNDEQVVNKPKHDDGGADDFSSVDSADSAVTVVEKKHKNDNEQGSGGKKATDPLEDHVDLIDHVQNTLLDQICGKPVNTNEKFDFDHFRQELHEASSLYHDNEKSQNSNNNDLLQYLNDFEPEDSKFDQRLLRSPNRELPDIEEEGETESKDSEVNVEGSRFCGTPRACSALSGKSSGCDQVEILHHQRGTGDGKASARSQMTEHSIPSLDDDKVDSPTPGEQGGSGLRHTSEFHDTVAVPLGVGLDDKEARPGPSSSSESEVEQRPESTDRGNQTSFHQVPAGAEDLIGGRVHTTDVDDDEGSAAQASLKPSVPLLYEDGVPRQSSSRDARQAMENENNNKRNNAISNSRNMEAEAATKIQAGFRGYQVRKQLKAKKTGTDTKRSLRRKSSPDQRKDADLEEKSAVKIQAGVRGFLVRRRQKKQVNSSASA